MNNKLPITISLGNTLRDEFPQFLAIASRLEAQFNFQTLMAGWYAEEETTLTTQLSIKHPLKLKTIISQYEDSEANDILITQFSDDVISVYTPKKHQISCNVAITESEMQLLATQPQILMQFIEKKLHKVLNLIAKQQQLTCF